MSIFYGYEAREDDKSLSTEGGTMKGDIDMSYWALKNIAAPVDDFDDVSKKIMEVKMENIPFRYKTVFNVNFADMIDLFKVDKYSGGGVKWIGEGNNLIVQNDEVRSVGIKKEGAISFLSTNDGVSRSRGMIFNCLEAITSNFSVFVVVRKSGGISGNRWETVWSCDNGGWDKFIGYKNGVDNVINYGGVEAVDLGEVTVPAGVDLTKNICCRHIG